MPKLHEDVRRDSGVQMFCLLALTLIAIGVAPYLLRPLLATFVLALFLADCLTLQINVQRRHLRARRGGGGEHGGFGRWAFVEIAAPWDAENIIRAGLQKGTKP